MPKRGRATQAPREPRERDVATVVALYRSLMGRHPAEGAAFLDVTISMAQAKVLFLVQAAAELHMSELAQRLHVSLSTVSGLVDRLVDHGLVSRHDDPTDRRQVLVAATPTGDALVDRFLQLGVRELEELLADLDDRELAAVREAFEVLERAVLRRAARP